MTEPNAKVICHSRSPDGSELVTMEIELHRFILPEFNTHRSLSRNFQSSRALPVLRQLEQIASDPTMPVYWGKEISGMQAKEELEGTDRELAEMIILGMRDACLNGVKQLQKLKLHKQISNRYVEPWMWTKGLVTATLEDFNELFKLRCHKDAQPEIKALADAMSDAIFDSVPTELNYGEYHLPYITFDMYEHTVTLEEAIKVSTSCCAQVSYRKLDNSLEKAIKIYDMLNLPEDGIFKEDPPHFSPTEHVAKVVDFTEMGGGNFGSGQFWQYRKALEVGLEGEFLV